MEKKRLSDSVADEIMMMITIEKRFLPGEKLPNENDLSEELKVSRTTLREAIRVLATNNIVEIRRGLGTFVRDDFDTEAKGDLTAMTSIKANARELYEVRLIVEPEAAYYATLRAGDEEIRHILMLGNKIEAAIADSKDRTEAERAFHKAIATATHNAFISKLLPVVYEAIDKGVRLSDNNDQVVRDTVKDHKMIMDFIEARNAEGARSAMKIHILHAISELKL